MKEVEVYLGYGTSTSYGTVYGNVNGRIIPLNISSGSENTTRRAVSSIFFQFFDFDESFNKKNYIVMDKKIKRLEEVNEE